LSYLHVVISESATLRRTGAYSQELSWGS